ncbi:MAG: FIST N-terminal domain-containing protein [Pseudomonadota bacterium]|nr:FIST N-terminal domain-containing protein [Pseudomonadota bacterium]
MFISPQADFDALTAEAARRFAPATVLACTTAGEIGNAGYEEDQIIAIGFPRDRFATAALLVAPLDDLNHQGEVDQVIRARLKLAGASPQMENEFAFLMVDGMSMREDGLTSMLSSGLGGVPLFGGSAGDGTEFQSTRLSLNGVTYSNAAILSLIRTTCPVKVFSLDHLAPTEMRMVVTEADPSRRVVRRINAEPAAAEYARMLGKDPNQLDQFTFAAHPVVVRLGDRHHVRAIQQVTPEGELVFFSAIDEGMVLTLAEPQHLAEHLDQGLTQIAGGDQPDMVLACDCILRRLEAGQKQMSRDVSEVLKKHNVTGFGTYGEQIGALHVNHTMTGVALYPPTSVPLTKVPLE